MFSCSSWPEDAPGGARPIPGPIRDGAPRRPQRGADQPQCRLCQSPQHVPTDECGRRCCSRGGLRALPHGRRQQWVEHAVVVVGSTEFGGLRWQPPRLGNKDPVSPLHPPSFYPPSSICCYIKLGPNTFRFTVFVDEKRQCLGATIVVQRTSGFLPAKSIFFF